MRYVFDSIQYQGMAREAAELPILWGDPRPRGLAGSRLTDHQPAT